MTGARITVPRNYRYCRSKCSWLLVGFEPLTAKTLCLVQNVNYIIAKLNYNSVLKVFALQIRLGAALVVADIKGEVGETWVRLHVDTLALPISSLREDDSVEGWIELGTDSHVLLPADDVQGGESRARHITDHLQSSRVLGLVGPQVSALFKQVILAVRLVGDNNNCMLIKSALHRSRSSLTQLRTVPRICVCLINDAKWALEQWQLWRATLTSTQLTQSKWAMNSRANDSTLEIVRGKDSLPLPSVIFFFIADRLLWFGEWSDWNGQKCRLLKISGSIFSSNEWSVVYAGEVADAVRKACYTTLTS